MSTANLSLLLNYLNATLTHDNMRWMASQLAKQADLQERSLKPYTIEEIDAMIDELTYGTMQEKIDFVKSFNKEVEKIEKRINEFKSSGC